jgi:hypothetical protein
MKLKEVSKVNTTKKQSKEIKERNQRMKSKWVFGSAKLTRLTRLPFQSDDG